MILVADIGNTTISLGLLNKNSDSTIDVIKTAKLPSDTDLNSKNIEEGLQTEFDNINPVNIDGAIISSVVPALTSAVEAAFQSLYNVSSIIVTKLVETNLIFKDIDINSVGNDRFVDAAWARHTLSLPAVTVDMGTATTVNVISADGVFLGGIISAGVNTSLTALHEHTAQLPQLSATFCDRIIGHNTSECMLSGAIYGQAAMIDGMVSRIEKELGSPVSLIITGGAGTYIHEHISHEHIYDPYLLFKGLYLIFDLNHK